MTGDNNELHAFAERLLAEHTGGPSDPLPAIALTAPQVLALCEEVKRLTEQNAILLEGKSAVNEALRKDAERYRFIRQGQMIEGESCSEGLCLDLWDAEGAGQMLVLEEADQAIDTAMAGERHYVH